MTTYEYDTTVEKDHPIVIPSHLTQNLSNGSKVRILIMVDEPAKIDALTTGPVIDEADESVSSLDAFMAELKAMPPIDHLLVPGDGRLAEYLANPVTEPDPDFDVEEWNREWQAVETQMKAEDKKHEQEELDRLQRLLS